MSDMDLEQAQQDAREARRKAMSTQAAKLIINQRMPRDRAIAKAKELFAEQDEAVRTGQIVEDEDGRTIDFPNSKLDGEALRAGTGPQVDAIAAELRETGAFDHVE